MTRDHAYVTEIMRAWASPFGDYPTPEDVERYGNAMALPFVAHSAAEHYRWFGRSQLRQDGPQALTPKEKRDLLLDRDSLYSVRDIPVETSQAA